MIFGSLVMGFTNDFHSWLHHSWKSLANRLTCDPKLLYKVTHALYFISYTFKLGDISYTLQSISHGCDLYSFWLPLVSYFSMIVKTITGMFIFITLQCCILAHTSLFSPTYITFWPIIHHFLAHCTSLFGPVAMPTNEPPTPPHTTHTPMHPHPHPLSWTQINFGWKSIKEKVKRKINIYKKWIDTWNLMKSLLNLLWCELL